MRIIELLEGKHFDESHYVKKTNDGETELDYDLPDDLIFFMHNDDTAHRLHVDHIIKKCINALKNKKKIDKSIFKPAINTCYKLYLKEYPIRELPDTLDKKLSNEICEKIYDEVCQHINDGKYD